MNKHKNVEFYKTMQKIKKESKKEETESDYSLFFKKDIEGILKKYYPLLTSKSIWLYEHHIKYDSAQDYEDAFQYNTEIALKAINNVFNRGLNIIDENFSFGYWLDNYINGYHHQIIHKKRIKTEHCPIGFERFEDYTDYLAGNSKNTAYFRYAFYNFENDIIFKIDYERFKDDLSDKEKDMLNMFENKEDRKRIAEIFKMKSPESVCYQKEIIGKKYYLFFKKAGYFKS